jgi:hypothetical protein
VTELTSWLAQRGASAPEQLRVRMERAIAAVPADGTMHERLALAAEHCLAHGCADASRASALDLLAADALLTHACEAAAEVGCDVLHAFAARWDASRFAAVADPA